MFTHIVVAVDFSGSSRRALEVATRMAADSKSQLTLVHVHTAPASAHAAQAFSTADFVTPSEHAAFEQMEALLDEISARWPHVDAYVRNAETSDGVLTTARDVGADLIVVGTHARHGLSRLILGSIAEHVIRESTIPVLVVRAALEGPVTG